MILLDMITELAYSEFHFAHDFTDATGRVTDELGDHIEECAGKICDLISEDEAFALMVAYPQLRDTITAASAFPGFVETIRSVIAGRLHWHWCMRHDHPDDANGWLMLDDTTIIEFRPPPGY